MNQITVTADRPNAVVRRGQTRRVALTPRIRALIDAGVLIRVPERLTEVPRVAMAPVGADQRPPEPRSAPIPWTHVGGGWYSHPDHDKRLRASDIPAGDEVER